LVARGAEDKASNSLRLLTLQVEEWMGGHMITILVVILVLMLIGALPAWPHSRNWGYRPSGGLGLVLVIVLILFLLGYV
jgi:Protein of unknown function (DUF3309)